MKALVFLHGFYEQNVIWNILHVWKIGGKKIYVIKNVASIIPRHKQLRLLTEAEKHTAITLVDFISDFCFNNILYPIVLYYNA